ncbi:hypothetical protein, partial [Rhizobium leguminosarum]|uniref:hypothetical protein n=1 Tax=Rhizobium leguminosarum TaxID=384 RepID=UPI003F99978D
STCRTCRLRGRAPRLLARYLQRYRFSPHRPVRRAKKTAFGAHGAARYHYKTRDTALGTIAQYRPGAWGYQETVLHL